MTGVQTCALPISSSFGVKFKFHSLSTTSSRFMILKVHCAGRSHKLSGLLPFQQAKDALRSYGFDAVSFSVLRKSSDKDKNLTALSIQCLYADGSNGT